MARDKKPFVGNTSQGFCILNAEKVPDLWTNATFGTREDAQRYIDCRHRMFGWDLSKHTVVPCTVAIRVINYDHETSMG